MCVASIVQCEIGWSIFEEALYTVSLCLCMYMYGDRQLEIVCRVNVVLGGEGKAWGIHVEGTGTEGKD